MRKRVNLTLSQETIDLIDRWVEKKDRNRFFEQAVGFYVLLLEIQSPKKRLKGGAQQKAKRNLRRAKK